jgi:hypothetical protein
MIKPSWPWALVLLGRIAACASNSSSSVLPTKRGLAFHTDEHSADMDLLLSDNSQISWYYTWSLWPIESISDSLVFLPLIHGTDDTDDEGELNERLEALPSSSTHLLSFNEPDGTTDSGGSSISPRDAARAYIDSIAPLRQRRRDRRRTWNISHPVVTSSAEEGQGIDWLRDFNSSCWDIDEERGCPADFVAVHYYGPFEGLRWHLDALRDFYGGGGMIEGDAGPTFWITEVAIPQADEEETLAMLNETIAYLEDADDVAGYAWFGAFRSNEANEWTGDEVSFFDGDGELTDVGSTYLGGEENGFEPGMTGEGDDDSAAVAFVPSVMLVALGVVAAVMIML